MKVQVYIPAKTKLVVRTPLNKVQDHTTKTDIVLHRDPGTARCPRMRRDVLTCEHDGHTVHFTEDMLATRIVPDDQAVAPEGGTNLKPCLLIYDIPDASEFPNPSGLLRRIAVRLNLSCWVISEDDIPYTMLHQMSEAGGDWHVVRFDSGEGRKLIAMAIAAIRREYDAAVQRGAETQRREDQRIDAAMSGDAVTAERLEEAHERYDYRRQAVEDRLKLLMADLEAAAARFGIEPTALRLQRSVRAAAAIQTAMHTRARVLMETARGLRSRGGSGAAMANAIEAGAVPAVIAADYADDTGDAELAVSAAALRDAFTPPADDQ